MRDRVDFWINFICENSQFPAVQRLRDQFSVATFLDFCNCGCNSFSVSVPEHLAIPIACSGSAGHMVFESAFQLQDIGKSLEILLFVDAIGNLSYVEIDCNGNSEPVPGIIKISGPPYHVYASQALSL